MKRGVVSKSPQAQLDVLDAGLYIAAGAPLVADRFVDSINVTFRRLAQYPKLGRARPELASDLRSFPHGNYVVFYRPTSTGVLIVRVLHLPAIFLRSWRKTERALSSASVPSAASGSARQ